MTDKEWNELTENFLKQCTYTDSLGVYHVAIDPISVVEWFRAKIDHHPEVGKMPPDEYDNTFHLDGGI